jgi:hypothetical protein
MFDHSVVDVVVVFRRNTLTLDSAVEESSRRSFPRTWGSLGGGKVVSRVVGPSVGSLRPVRGGGSVRSSAGLGLVYQE